MTTVSCPTCKRSVEWSAAARWRPFCSERCKLIDLGEWASERNVIPGEHISAEAMSDAGMSDGGTADIGADAESDAPRKRY
jgi:endogenous inhibitor of DNA gyrase (YacG/DUF329 family)